MKNQPLKVGTKPRASFGFVDAQGRPSLKFPSRLAREETNFLHISQLGHEEVFGRDSRPCRCNGLPGKCLD